MKQTKLVEKKNRNAVHGVFSNRKYAERHLREEIPLYCARGYFTDKTLTPDSFVVVECGAAQ
jgi:hypothetical protein